MRKISVLSLTLLITFLLALPIQAQEEELALMNVAASHEFSQQITFEADLSGDQDIESIWVIFSTPGLTQTQTVEASLSEGLHVTATHEITSGNQIRPFTPLSYWFIAETTSGDQLFSQAYNYVYDDHSKDWRSLEDDQFTVHWYQGDLEMAQTILDTANQALSRNLEYLSLDTPEFIHIYIYPSSNDLQEALGGFVSPWIAGHADPDLNTILAVIQPGPEQNLDIESKIPHELAHIQLYQTFGSEGYARLPTWINEGVASLMQFYTSPEYLQVLEQAYLNESLIPFSQLCQSFPTGSEDIQLAYAQSDSIVRYIHQQYGTVGLEQILLNYSEGFSCEDGTQTFTSFTLSQLESQWRIAIFEENQINRAIRLFTPWTSIFLLFILGIGLLVINQIKRVRENGAE